MTDRSAPPPVEVTDAMAAVTRALLTLPPAAVETVRRRTPADRRHRGTGQVGPSADHGTG